jgi:hypothetical protein
MLTLLDQARDHLYSQSPMDADGGAVMGRIMTRRNTDSLVNIAHSTKDQRAGSKLRVTAPGRFPVRRLWHRLAAYRINPAFFNVGRSRSPSRLPFVRCECSEFAPDSNFPAVFRRTSDGSPIGHRGNSLNEYTTGFQLDRRVRRAPYSATTRSPPQHPAASLPPPSAPSWAMPRQPKITERFLVSRAAKIKLTTTNLIHPLRSLPLTHYSLALDARSRD